MTFQKVFEDFFRQPMRDGLQRNLTNAMPEREITKRVPIKMCRTYKFKEAFKNVMLIKYHNNI
jgi:hypothetical protein